MLLKKQKIFCKRFQLKPDSDLSVTIFKNSADTGMPYVGIKISSTNPFLSFRRAKFVFLHTRTDWRDLDRKRLADPQHIMHIMNGRFV